MDPYNKMLTPEEIKRNTHGPMSVYTYTKSDLGSYEAPEYFPPVKVNHAHYQPLTVEEIRVSPEKLVKGLYPGISMFVYYPGFPTMRHLNYRVSNFNNSKLM